MRFATSFATASRTQIKTWLELRWLGALVGMALAVLSLFGWHTLRAEIDEQLESRLNQRAAAIANELAIKAQERTFSLLRTGARYANGVYRSEAEWASDIDANLAHLPALEQVLILNSDGQLIWWRGRSPQDLTALELPDLSAIPSEVSGICPIILQREKLWVVCSGRRGNGQPFQTLASLRLEIVTEQLVRNQAAQGFSLSVVKTADRPQEDKPRAGAIYGQAAVPAPLDMLAVRIEAGKEVRTAATRLANFRLWVGFAIAALLAVVIAQAQQSRRRARDLARINQTLETRTHALQAANENLEQFSYAASHDLKTPIRSMVSFAQLLERNVAKGDTVSLKEFTGEIVSAGNRLSELIDTLLEVARTGHITPEQLRNVPVRTTVDTALAVLRESIEERKAQIEIGALPQLVTEPMLLALVWQNLIGNAIKYQTGGTPYVGVFSRKIPDGWEFRVVDHGPGIEPRVQEDIFKLFRRGTPPAGVEGNGIGLTVVRRIINGLGGRIWVESQQGQGAQFKFFLPDRPLLTPA